MDYEKKYNEALKRAKDFMNGIVQFAIDPGESIVHYIFPELRESEDERIRKAIVNLMEVASEAYLIEATGFKKEQFLSYLEKQKKQKPNIEICPHSTKSKSYKETGYPSVTRFVYNKSDEEFIRDCANILKANDYEPSAERLLSMIEQKPISQEDFDTAKHEALWGEQKPRDYCSVRDEFDLDGNLKQKPAEWSEEDEKRLNAVVELLENTSAIHPNYSHRKLIIWLKSLRPQPKQEWSGEDERILKGIIGKIDHDQTYGVSKDEMLNFLKKL